MQHQSDSSRRREIIGLALAAVGTALFSLKAIVIKLSYVYTVDAVTLQTLRMALSVPLFLLIAAVLVGIGGGRPLSRRQWLAIAALGLCGYYAASILDLLGLQYVSAGLERLILYVYPTIVLLIGSVLFGRRIQRREIIGIAVSYVGLMVVFAQDVRLYSEHTALGALLVLASAAAYAVFIAGSGRLIPAVGSMRFTCYAMTAAGIGVGTHFIVTQPADLLQLPPQVYWLGILLAAGCTVLPSFMIAAGIGRIGAERSAAMGMIGPACTLMLGNLILDEPLTAAHVTGATLVMGGIFYMSRKPAAVSAATPATSPRNL